MATVLVVSAPDAIAFMQSISWKSSALPLSPHFLQSTGSAGFTVVLQETLNVAGISLLLGWHIYFRKCFRQYDKVPDRRPTGFPYWKTKRTWGQKGSQDFAATVLMRNDKGWNKRWEINSTGGLVQHLIKQSICFWLYISRLQIKI